jgi:hypothetical protein
MADCRNIPEASFIEPIAAKEFSLIAHDRRMLIDLNCFTAHYPPER